MTERHYKTREVAEMWSCSQKTIKRIFSQEPGVLILGPMNARHRRTRNEIRIPSSVLERVWKERSGGLQRCLNGIAAASSDWRSDG